MKVVDKIVRIPLKEAFSNEPREMTPWLCANIDVIGEAINMELSNGECEQTTGNFYVDIKAENSNGDMVIIENQFGASNHDHLGKLITYLTSFEAKVAIWIVEIPKQEHINAINWLNESDNGCYFYLLKLEAIKISESNPAPLLSCIARPSEESRQIGKIKKEHSTQDIIRQKFWAQLLQTLKDYGVRTFSNTTTSGKYAYIAANAGSQGLFFEIWANQYSTRIELRIDHGKGADSLNLESLNKFKLHKEAIESSFGGELNWAELEGYRACSIRKDFETGGYMSDEVHWGTIINEIVLAMKKLIETINPFVKSLR